MDAVTPIPETTKPTITPCDGLILGTILGHLADHGFTDEEITGFVAIILAKVREVKNDPKRAAALEKALRTAVAP